MTTREVAPTKQINFTAGIDSHIGNLANIEQFPKRQWMEVARTSAREIIKSSSDYTSLAYLAISAYAVLANGYKNHDKDMRRAAEDVFKQLENYFSENCVARTVSPDGAYLPESSKVLKDQLQK